MALNAQTILAKYTSGVQNGAANYRLGVTGKGPTWQTNAASDAAEARFAAGIQRAIAARSRQTQVARVSAQTWEQQAINVGAAAYTQSAQKAATNYGAIVNDVIGAASAAQAAAAGIDGSTLAARLQRGPAAATAIHRYWAQRNGVTPEV